MAVKNIIARGIGFSPGSLKFIVTHGFGSAEVVATHAALVLSESLTAVLALTETLLATLTLTEEPTP